jgi:hypothetical protein
VHVLQVSGNVLELLDDPRFWQRLVWPWPG